MQSEILFWGALALGILGGPWVLAAVAMRRAGLARDRAQHFLAPASELADTEKAPLAA